MGKTAKDLLESLRQKQQAAQAIKKKPRKRRRRKKQQKPPRTDPYSVLIPPKPKAVKVKPPKPKPKKREEPPEPPRIMPKDDRFIQIWKAAVSIQVVMDFFALREDEVRGMYERLKKKGKLRLLPRA